MNFISLFSSILTQDGIKCFPLAAVLLTESNPRLELAPPGLRASVPGNRAELADNDVDVKACTVRPARE